MGGRVNTTIRQHSLVDETLLENLAALERAIFPEPLSKEQLAQELRSRHNLCVLVAWCGKEPAGYKIGYELSGDVFYSFSGGVVPEYRRQGIARALMSEQHRIARALDYAMVRTHTKNKYRDMLLLNIRSGFDVTGVNHKSGEKFHSIILEKVLTSTNDEPAA